MSPLEIIYQDKHLVAINKPSGLLVHRSNIDRHETRFALQLLRDQLGQHVYPVHRLDKPTSGVLLFALSSEIARLLSESFSSNLVKKTYLAIVRGWCPEQGSIDHPLKPQFDKMTDKDKLKNKPAQQTLTHFNRLATVELPFAVDRYPQSRYSLVEVKPVTGRKHQIRRHFKHIAHPIIGDTEHGDHRHNRMFRERLNVDQMCLVATELKILDPASGKPLCIRAEPCGEMKRVLRQNGYDATSMH